ncbi:hypothetical protein [Nonomuraea sp. NPDC003804]|uniref:hypothetical protein n=1 Tax=Nonomuraea sp. NPDC003804 TaxID=3154547 RepID=UPI0033AB1CF1
MTREQGAHGLKMYSAARHDGVEPSLLQAERALFVEGDLQTSRKWFDTAYCEAECGGDGPAMARAALGLGGLWVHEHRGMADAEMVRARQRRALALLDPGATLGLRLRIRLAGEEDYRTGAHVAIEKMLVEARVAGDAPATAEALSLAHHCLLGPEHGAQRLELAKELIGEASRTGRRSDLVMGLLWHALDLLLAGDPHAERRLRELHALLALEDHLAAGFVVDAIEVMRSIRGGRFAQAEIQAAACAERGAAVGDADATAWHGGQLAAIRWYQGRITELVPLLSELVDSPTLSAVDNSPLAVMAVAAATAGERRVAAGALARLRGRNLADLPHSSTWLVSMYGAVEAAHLLQDADTSAQAYALVAPFAHLPVVASLGVACLGSAHHLLGVASMTTGDLDRAVEHLRAAVQDNLRLEHWPAIVLSRSRLGQALALRDGPRDEAARRELARAAQEAAALGMMLPGDGLPAPVSRAGGWGGGEGRHRVSCRRRGRRWQVELGDRSVLVEHSVGMAHLASLLANPGYEIPAVDLAAGPGRKGAQAAEGAAISAQPVLDDRARREYKQRLLHLQAEIDEYESMNDPERAAAVRAERDWLIAELTAASGTAGRVRRFAGNEERARIAVGKAIRRALARVAEADPVIGHELRDTVQTGLRCCYRPD